MKPLHPCQLTKEVEPFWVKHDNVLIAKQAEFVNKELSASINTISIKKIIMPNPLEETELDNAYQKTLITGIENKSNKVTRKRACTNERMVHFE